MTTSGWPVILFAALLGLLVGSFLNVLIHRLPRMLEAAWDADHLAWLHMQQDVAQDSGAALPRGIERGIEQGTTNAVSTNTAPPQATSHRFNLWLPASHCPACSTPLRWFENIPVLSYLWLRGRCSHCQTRISSRYPLVELASALLAGYCVWRYGFTWPALAWFGFTATLLSLALIDWDTTYLPDSLTLPLLWGGLLASAMGWTGTLLADAVWGATIGYGSLRLVHEVFLRITGKEGMGHGDFKLLAAIGAWLGWPALLPVLLLASIVGLIVGLALKARNRLDASGQLPFGPFLALGAALGWTIGSNWLFQLLA